jgi:hypothetical protein
MIKLDIVYDRVLDTKFNVNYKTVIEYDYQNTLILLYYSLLYYHTILIKNIIIKHIQPLNLPILLWFQRSIMKCKSPLELCLCGCGQPAAG